MSPSFFLCSSRSSAKWSCGGSPRPETCSWRLSWSSGVRGSHKPTWWRRLTCGVLWVNSISWGLAPPLKSCETWLEACSRVPPDLWPREQGVRDPQMFFACCFAETQAPVEESFEEGEKTSLSYKVKGLDLITNNMWRIISQLNMNTSLEFVSR